MRAVVRNILILGSIGAIAATIGIAGAVAYPPHAHVASTGKRGPRGKTGPRGPRGFTGASGSVGGVISVDSPTITLQPGDTSFDVDPNGFQATCPSGYSVIGTGFDGGIGNVDFVLAFGAFVGGFIDNSTSVPFDVHLQAICAAVSSSGAAGASDGGLSPAQQYRQALVAAAATH